MKLDELKSLWESSSRPDPDFDQAYLGSLLRSRGQSALSKIQRNIRLEIIFLGLSAVGILAWFFVRPLPVHWGEWVIFTFLFPGSGLLYWYKFRAFVRREHLTQDLFHSLDSYIHSLDRYLNYYRLVMTFMVPILSVVGILYGFSISRAEDGRSLEDVDLGTWAILGVASLIYIALAYWFTKWYMKHLYGNHLEELKAVRAELVESQAG